MVDEVTVPTVICSAFFGLHGQHVNERYGEEKPVFNNPWCLVLMDSLTSKRS